jgi:uncharacterized protein YggU (UPF0235/DUF167 family)
LEEIAAEDADAGCYGYLPGKARGFNAMLVAFLAEVFGVPQRQVVLKRGNRSRRKVIEIIQLCADPKS